MQNQKDKLLQQLGECRDVCIKLNLDLAAQMIDIAIEDLCNDEPPTTYEPAPEDLLTQYLEGARKQKAFV